MSPGTDTGVYINSEYVTRLMPVSDRGPQGRRDNNSPPTAVANYSALMSKRTGTKCVVPNIIDNCESILYRYDPPLGCLARALVNSDHFVWGRHESMSPRPYPEPVVFQWQSSGNPVCLELRPQCTLECHWRLNVGSQWSSSGFPVVYQCVPIMQINTGSPLGHHWVLASVSVVPVASQCTCGSSGLPVCSNYAN